MGTDTLPFHRAGLVSEQRLVGILLAVLQFAIQDATFKFVSVRSSLTPNQQSGIDTCPECTILEPVSSWPNLDVAPVGRSGPCGYNARVSVDYNAPGSSWGSNT